MLNNQLKFYKAMEGHRYLYSQDLQENDRDDFTSDLASIGRATDLQFTSKILISLRKFRSPTLTTSQSLGLETRFTMRRSVTNLGLQV